MKIAALSFEISDKNNDKGIGPMVIDSGKRIQYILDVIKEHKPTLLVCSGYTVETNLDLDNLVSKLKEIKTDSALLVEVRKDIILEEHKIFFIDSDQNVKDLGKQYFATRSALESKEGKERLEIFDNNIEQRKFKIGDKNVFALICGEINAIKGRKDIKYMSDKIEESIKEADIILNPTHDCMANYGTLKAKRIFLSQQIDGRTRVYINSSNWNSYKKKENGKIVKQNPVTNSFMQNFYSNAVKTETKQTLNKDYLLNLADIFFLD